LDPVFDSGFTYGDDRAPRSAPAFQGSRSRTETYSAGLSQSTLLGTEARLSASSARLSNATPFRFMDPTVDSRLALSISQPLWRYFAGRPDVARRRRARAGAAAAENLLRQAREEVSGRAARAFLEWRHASDLVRINEGGVADAKSLLAKYEDKRRYGLVEEGDLLQAQASLESQEIQLLVARSRVETAGHALTAALSRPGGDLPPPSREPAARPAALDGLAEEEAVAGLPSLAAARSRRERAEWERRVSVLDTYPDLRLKADYGFAGLSGRVGPSWSDVGGWRHPVASVGATFSVPLGFKRERLTRRAAELRLEAAAAEEASARTAAQRERRDALEALRLARRRAEAGRRLFELERRKFAAEEAQFKRGRSTTDLLLRSQQDIRRAEAELLRAETDEALARVELARASGRLASELAP
jgi:outer membrane protein TolC